MQTILKKLNIKVKTCNTFKTRLCGFMFQRRKINHALYFPHCRSIHTWFMLQKIDVIMTDNKHQLLYTYKALKPFCLLTPKKNVAHIYELPLGTIEKIKNSGL